MKAITLPTFAVNGEITLDYASSMTSGHGQKTITVELTYRGEKKEFSKTTNNMSDYDDATELEGFEKKEEMYNLISYAIEEEVAVWTQEIDCEIENSEL